MDRKQTLFPIIMRIHFPILTHMAKTIYANTAAKIMKMINATKANNCRKSTLPNRD